MSKPFNLEAAKKGEPIQVDQQSFWYDAFFVGVSANGYFVVQRALDNGKGYTGTLSVNAEDLRMAPKKTVWYCRCYVSEGIPYMSKTLSADYTWPDEQGSHWVGKPFTIEVEE